MARCEQCSAEHATKKCGACKAVTYCSKECQKAHFRQHKKVCAQLAQGAFGVRLLSTGSANCGLRHRRRTLLASSRKAVAHWMSCQFALDSSAGKLVAGGKCKA